MLSKSVKARLEDHRLELLKTGDKQLKASDKEDLAEALLSIIVAVSITLVLLLLVQLLLCAVRLSQWTYLPTVCPPIVAITYRYIQLRILYLSHPVGY